MKIAIAGGTGFIGGRLASYLREQNDHIVFITRSKGRIDADAEYIGWDELEQNTDRLERLDAIVNLAGESINQRWTQGAKQRIVQSRLDAAAAVARLVDRLEHKPQVVVNASGISVYGASELDSFTEESPCRITDFLADTIVRWEEAADAIENTRVVKLRVGLVLGNGGGAYPKMTLPYRLGVGGKVGNGRQWISWIHIDDMVRLIEYCITHRKIDGPVNASAPNPVTNDEFGRAAARALGRPHWLPVPAFVMKLIFGELSCLLLTGQKAYPKKLLDHGFEFMYPTIDSALRQLSEGGKTG